MIAAGKIQGCQPAKFFHIADYRELRSAACRVSMSSLGSRPENACDKVLCKAMASAAKGLRGKRLKRLRILMWWLRYVLFDWNSKPCGTYAKRRSGTSDVLDKRFKAHYATCRRQIVEGSRSHAITIGGRRYGSWKDFLFKEPRVRCSSRRRINVYNVTPRCIKPLLPLAKIKRLLQRKYGRITYKKVTKGPVYTLDVIIHRRINRDKRDDGKYRLEVNGHTGRVLRVDGAEKPEDITDFPFGDIAD